MELKIIIVKLSFGTLSIHAVGQKHASIFKAKINFQNRFVANNKDFKLIGSFSWKTKQKYGEKTEKSLW